MLNIPAQRLAAQRISKSEFTTPAQVVSWLGALQGQDYPGALWSVGLRLPHSTAASIEQALAETRIVRTWVMRGTLHVVAAEDVRWMTELLGPKIISGIAARYRQLELDDETMHRSIDIFANALRDGQDLDRPALLALLNAQGISTEGQRAPHLLQRACYEGIMCQTTTLKHPTYTALDDRFPRRTWTREEAVAELTRRYVLSRGPVTIQDFVQWSGLTLTEARAGFAAHKALFSEETLNGQSYWWDASAPIARMPSVMFLLPGFDEYLLGYKDRTAVLDPAYAQRVCPGNNGVFMPTMVSQGRMIGLWKKTFRKETLILGAEPFSTFTIADKEAFAAASRPYGAFLGVSMVMPELR